jgi:molecular chaperone IbpA
MRKLIPTLGAHRPKAVRTCPALVADEMHVASIGEYAMRQYDLPSLYRSTIGFDRLFSMLDQVSGESQNYPPYNIERVGENAYRLTVAAAGFSADELSIEVKENALTLRGEKKAAAGESKSEMVYQGIAARAFDRRFQLADFVQVTGASLENGLLHIDLVREIPEAKKPRLVPINARVANDHAVETKKAA